MTPPLPSAPALAAAPAAAAPSVAALTAALHGASTPRSLSFWTRYMKGAAQFIGVSMADTRRVVHRWWRDHGHGDALSVADQKALALHLLTLPYAEQRLCGVLLLAEVLLPHLSAADLPALAALFDAGYVADWSLCDWLCVKVLGPLVAQAPTPSDRAATARAITAWGSAPNLWRRRASCVAFVTLARHGDAACPDLPSLLLDACDALTRDLARFAQTGAGWALRELSVFDRAAVIAFTEARITRLSAEGLRYVTEKMPPDTQQRLRALRQAAKR